MKTLLGTMVAMILVFACWPVQAASETAISPEAEPEAEVGQRIQNYLDSLASDKKLSGAVLVAKDGAPIASKASGIANRSTETPITLETKFNLGSMNKMFTGIAVTQLAQQGKLDFNDSISKHLPDYPNKDVAAKVTIHQLLTHTSGMGTTNFALSEPG
jgi:CubicO group peptidase (beta-lactamase class C family)